jgi:hypothetical protein
MFQKIQGDSRGETKGGSGVGTEQGAPSAEAKDSRFLDRLRDKSDVYEALTGLPFQVRRGSRTSFDHSTDPGTVIVGVGQLEKLGITERLQVDFIVLHELGHFYELSQDPSGYRSVIDEGKRSDGLGRSYFRFYNALLDIYVNRNTLNRAPVYGDGSGGFSPEIQKMYTERLFKDRDLTSLPKSTQYSYALLNIGMGVGADLQVSSEVRKALDEPLKLFGENISTGEIIERFLVPAIGIRAKGEWHATVSERRSVIDRTFRKRFEELIEQDKKENQDPNSGDLGGDLEGVEPSIEDIEEATKQIERKIEEANKSAEEKAADQRAKAAEDQAKEHLSSEQAHDLAETHRRVYPQILQVAEILQEIVRDTISHRKVSEGFFTQGEALDVPEVIEHFHGIRTNPTQAAIFTKDVYQEVITQQPQHVRLWGVFDLSGSMEGDIKLVRELSVICAGAAQTLSLGAELDQHSLRASFGSVGYNNDAFEILPLTDHPNYADIAKSYAKLSADGDTYEAPALRMVADRIRKLPRDEGVVDIVVAVTDGDTSKELESKAAIQELQNLGAKLLAFKFGRNYKVSDVKPKEGEGPTPDGLPFMRPEPDSGTFGRVWGTRGYQVRRVEQVVPAMRDGLKEIIKSV